MQLRNKILTAILLLVSYLGYGQYSPYTAKFSTISEMKGQRGNNLTLAIVAGRDSANDRQGGTYYWNDTATAANDNDNVVSVTGITTGRWVRREIVRQYFVKAVNALGVGNYKIFTTAPSIYFGRFVVRHINIVSKTSTGSILIGPIINVGYTSPNYNDLATGFTATNFVALNTSIFATLINPLPTIPGSTDVYIRVTTAATGLSAGTFDLYIDGTYEL